MLNYDPKLNHELHKEDLDFFPKVRLATKLKSTTTATGKAHIKLSLVESKSPDGQRPIGSVGLSE